MTKQIIPVRLAFTLPPIVAINVVITVPTVAPKTRYTALLNPKAPVLTIAMAIPDVAELDCNNAVTIAPIKTSSSGKSIAPKKALMASVNSGVFVIALLMVCKPKNNKPKPARISPMFLTFSFLINIKITPITASKIK